MWRRHNNILNYSCQLQPSWNAQCTFPEIGPIYYMSQLYPSLPDCLGIQHNCEMHGIDRLCIQLEILNLVVGPQISAHCKKMSAALNLVII